LSSEARGSTRELGRVQVTSTATVEFETDKPGRVGYSRMKIDFGESRDRVLVIVE
jgi:hypothetical protein